MVSPVKMHLDSPGRSCTMAESAKSKSADNSPIQQWGTAGASSSTRLFAKNAAGFVSKEK